MRHSGAIAVQQRSSTGGGGSGATSSQSISLSNSWLSLKWHRPFARWLARAKASKKRLVAAVPITGHLSQLLAYIYIFLKKAPSKRVDIIGRGSVFMIINIENRKASVEECAHSATPLGNYLHLRSRKPNQRL